MKAKLFENKQKRKEEEEEEEDSVQEPGKETLNPAVETRPV